MITFKNKKALIITTTSPLIEEISRKLINQGVKVISVNKNIDNLKEKIQESMTFNNEKFDIFIYYEPIVEKATISSRIESLINIDLYIDLLSKETYFKKEVSVLNITSNTLYPESLSKELSLKFFKEKIRVNSLIIDENESLKNIKKTSYMSLFLLSNNAKFIVGETYNIQEIEI